MSNSQGIQTLLGAEKEASKIVQKAREYRGSKIKEAQSEAQKEIDEYKAQRQKEFEEYEKQHSGTTESIQDAIDKETGEKLNGINASFEKNKDTVISYMLDNITKVDATAHRNLNTNST